MISRGCLYLTQVSPSHFTFKTTSRSLSFNRPNASKNLVFASIERPKWNYTSHFSNDSDCRSGKKPRRQNKCGGGGKREVHCEVEVVSWRERRIKAEISVDADIQSLWNALTDYERLSDFIPNLVSSGRIPCPYPGRIWLEQRGLQRALYWHIEARVVLDLEEFINSMTDRDLRFSMVDGDFKKFEGKWSLKSGSRSSTTILSYEVNVIPKFNFPAIFLERIIRSDLPVNLQALACRAEKSILGNQNLPIAESFLNRRSTASASITVDIDGVILKKNNLLPTESEEKYASSGFVPLAPVNSELNSNWGGMFGKFGKINRPCMVDEVHLRRFDGLLENGGVHRCVVASITVKAPVRKVWNVLTAYERLPEIVPNLAISKILSRESNKVRILQEGCKGVLYMVLHARVILDLCEHLEEEIRFEQVEGDFHAFHGKWILEQLGTHHTLLKYSVESKMHKNSLLSEAIMEEVIYEDLPSNLCAIRDYIEEETENILQTHNHITYAEEQTDSSCSDRSFEYDNYLTEHHSDCNGPNSTRLRPKVPGLQRDMEILKAELLTFIAKHGQEGFMPMRKQLREHGRVDIEKAITRMGGFRRIASSMNLSLAYKHRKPKGYWDNLENLKEEISRFQRNWGMDPLCMPSRKSFERAGRYDIARALEKWGGLHEVSRLLSLKVRHPNRQASLSKDKKLDSVAPSDDVNGQDRTPSNKTFVSQDTQKWRMKLKELDINWVE